MLPHYNLNPRLSPFLIEKRLFTRNPFFVADVGCSGGVCKYTSALWGTDQYRAVGFDPIITEIERLKKINTHPAVEYVEAYVGCNNNAPRMYDENDRPPQKDPDYTTTFSDRTSSRLALALGNASYAETYYTKGEKLTFTNRTVTLDEYFKAEDKKNINFLKVDTDGSDHLVLMGAEEILHSPNLLGLYVEVSFHSRLWKADNSFPVIDRILRKFGFSLYDMEVYRYARGALPSPFVQEGPAQSVSGQVDWCDAVYFRDYGRPDYESHWFAPPSVISILKLACLFETNGLPDCAAELLLKYEKEVEKAVPVKPLLDLLTPGAKL